MLTVQGDFDKAAEEAKALPDQTSNDDKLVLYGLFKQGTVGDVNSGKPGIWDPKGAQLQLLGAGNKQVAEKQWLFAWLQAVQSGMHGRSRRVSLSSPLPWTTVHEACCNIFLGLLQARTRRLPRRSTSSERLSRPV